MITPAKPAIHPVISTCPMCSNSSYLRAPASRSDRIRVIESNRHAATRCPAGTQHATRPATCTAAALSTDSPRTAPLKALTPHSGYHFDGSNRRFFEGWYFKARLDPCATLPARDVRRQGSAGVCVQTPLQTPTQARFQTIYRRICRM